MALGLSTRGMAGSHMIRAWHGLLVSGCGPRMFRPAVVVVQHQQDMRVRTDW